MAAEDDEEDEEEEQVNAADAFFAMTEVIVKRERERNYSYTQTACQVDACEQW